MDQKLNNQEQLRIREGFPKQRLEILPPIVIRRCQKLPLVSNLYISDIGEYPSALHHYIEREKGSPQAILIYCLAGKGTLEMDNTTHSIQKGHLMLIPPESPHLYQADAADPWSLFWIHFSGQQTLAVLKSLGVDVTHPVLYIPDTHLMHNAFEDVYACLNYNYSDAGLLAMTSELMRLLSKIKLHQGHLRPQRQSVENQVLDTIPFMEQHLNMPITLKELAAHSGQSIPYYSKLFRKRTNQSPMAYFIQLKIRKACELLDQTELSIRELALELGYDDPYYFSRIFKKVQDTSPSEYRLNIKGNMG